MLTVEKGLKNEGSVEGKMERMKEARKEGKRKKGRNILLWNTCMCPPKFTICTLTSIVAIFGVRK